MTQRLSLCGLALVAGAAAALAGPPLPEPVGIPMRAMGTPMPGVSPFSARYQAAYYHQQVEMMRYQAWLAERQAWIEARRAMGGQPAPGLAANGPAAPNGPVQVAATVPATPEPVFKEVPANLQDVPVGTIIKREIISEKVYRMNPDGTRTEVSAAEFPAGKPTGTVIVPGNAAAKPVVGKPVAGKPTMVVAKPVPAKPLMVAAKPIPQAGRPMTAVKSAVVPKPLAQGVTPVSAVIEMPASAPLPTGNTLLTIPEEMVIRELVQPAK